MQLPKIQFQLIIATKLAQCGISSGWLRYAKQKGLPSQQSVCARSLTSCLALHYIYVPTRCYHVVLESEFEFEPVDDKQGTRVWVVLFLLS